jgi:hypothetical protein
VSGKDTKAVWVWRCGPVVLGRVDALDGIFGAVWRYCASSPCDEGNLVDLPNA